MIPTNLATGWGNFPSRWGRSDSLGGIDKYQMRASALELDYVSLDTATFDPLKKFLLSISSTPTIAGYEALSDEPSLAALGLDFLVPRVVGAQLEFVGRGGQTRRSSLGIVEPVDSVAEPVVNIDAFLVPGVMFGWDGSRLGRGGGYYDRFFDSFNCAAPKIGIARSPQHVVAEVPSEPHDVVMTHIFDGFKLVAVH